MAASNGPGPSDQAIEGGADCVKFQMRSIETLYSNGADPDDRRANLSVQYVIGRRPPRRVDAGRDVQAVHVCHGAWN